MEDVKIRKWTSVNYNTTTPHQGRILMQEVCSKVKAPESVMCVLLFVHRLILRSTKPTIINFYFPWKTLKHAKQPSWCRCWP
jgi:hypothetical protein